MWHISILLLLGQGYCEEGGMDTTAFQSYFYICQAQRERSESPVSQLATCLSYLPFFVSLPLSIFVCTSLSSISLAPSLALSLSLSFCLPFISLSHLSVSLYLSFCLYLSVFNLLFSLLSLFLCVSLSLFTSLSLLYGPLRLSSSLSSVFVTLLCITHLLPVFLSSSFCNCLLFLSAL